MKRLIYSLLFMSCLLTQTGCSNNLILGFSPVNIPITLSLSNHGCHIAFNGSIFTPLGTISITAPIPEHYYNTHVTYVELINRLDNEKCYFCLDNVGDFIKCESSHCTISVHNRSAYSTVVTVESDEITNILHKQKGKDAGFKPDFPDTPIRYFTLVKALNSHVNWEIHSVADFVGDIIFGILWFFACLLDLMIIIILFVLRFFWWVLLLLGYLVGIV